MSTVYGLADMSDRREIVDFLNMVFSMSSRPLDFKLMMPKVYADDAPWFERTKHFVERADGRIAAVVALLPLDARVLDSRLKFGFIGSVSAHPYERGRGAMKKLMGMAHDHAVQNEFDALTLGGQRQRYEYFGYKKAGSLRVYRINQANVKHGLKDVSADGIIIHKVDKGDTGLLDKIHELHCRQNVAVERPRGALYEILSTWQYDIFAFTRGDSFFGYALINDKNDSCSELVVTDAANLKPVIKAIMNNCGNLEVTLRSYQRLEKACLDEFAEGWRIEQELQVNLLNGKLEEAYAALHGGNGDVIGGEIPAALDFPAADMF